jgi:hypothetical protein
MTETPGAWFATEGRYEIAVPPPRAVIVSLLIAIEPVSRAQSVTSDELIVGVEVARACRVSVDRYEDSPTSVPLSELVDLRCANFGDAAAKPRVSVSELDAPAGGVSEEDATHSVTIHF